ncbi:MAG: autotransporter assembly complex family protein [Halioglobus sp.]
MFRIASIFLLVLTFYSGLTYGSSLEYSVTGVRSELRENIEAWLGAAPETPAERSNFVASVEGNVRQSVKALGYYRPDIDIVIDKSSSPWSMIVAVTPNEPVRITQIDVAIAGEAKDDPEFIALLASLPFAAGDILHHGVYDGFKKQLIALGQRRGYFDGVISRNRVTVNADQHSVNITLHMSSGVRYRFGEVSMDEGLMDMRWVESLMHIQPGDLFDMSALQKLRSELQQTRYFSSVSVRAEVENLANGLVPISVTLAPVNRHSIEVGVGFSTDTQERISLTWRTPLINRYGHSQETRLEYSTINPRGRFTYNIPLSHPLNDVLQLSAYLEDNEYGDLESNQKGVRVRREMRKGKWIASYSARTLDESWELQQVHRDNSYVLPGASLSHKSRSGSLVDPEAGLHQAYYAEGGHEDIGSDINLFRIYSNFRFVAPLSARQRLVARAELGAVFISSGDRGDLAPSLSFFAGGSQSIRGFSYQSIGNEVLVEGPDGVSRSVTVGGDRLVTASLEYQYYVTDTWRGALFADAGDAFDEGDFDAKYGAGVGVHYMSPVGAIRLELARDISEDSPSWRVHINIGAEF